MQESVLRNSQISPYGINQPVSLDLILEGGNNAAVIEAPHEPKHLMCDPGDMGIMELKNSDCFHNLEIADPVLCDILSRPLDSGCSVECPVPLEDPLLAHICTKVDRVEDHVWVDPIVMNENAAFVSSMVMTPSIHRKASKPRGRPRKAIDQPSSSINPSHSPSCWLLEAQKTWETAKILGISTNDEKAALSALRKSKRLLILEGNTA